MDQNFLQFSRQIILPGFGIEAQQKLKNAKVLLIGCGGLGGPAALYLLAAGVGHLGLVDADQVSVSNLHRQILFDHNDIGKNKAEAARIRLSHIYPDATLDVYPVRLNAKNAQEISQNYNYFLDGSDNFPTKYLLSDLAEISNKPWVFAAVHQYEAQVSTFNYLGGPNYRDIFPEPPLPDQAPDCSTAGVLGPVVGMVASIQALELIKVICGLEKTLSGYLLLLEFTSYNQRKIKIQKAERPNIKALIDYDEFCGNNLSLSFSKDALEALDDDSYQLIDIRTLAERENFNIGGLHLESEELQENIKSLNSQKLILLYCATGKRSKIAAESLSKIYPYLNIKYLNATLEQFY